MENCEYGHGRCTAPDTKCIHWMGIFCELDAVEHKIEKYNQAVNEIEQFVAAHPEILDRAAKKYTEKLVDVKDVAIGDKNKFVIKADCHKCVYEIGCHGDPVNCKSYKRDAPDGGYYG